jgi:hypothetical protein
MFPELVKFGVLTVVTMKANSVWDVTPCSLVEVYLYRLQTSITSRRCVKEDTNFYQATRLHISYESSQMLSLIFTESCNRVAQAVA